jgi:hypothetical protein
LGSALSEPCDALLGSLANTLEGLIRSLADLSDSLARPFANLTDRLAGTLADALHRALGSFADILDCLASLPDEVPSALACLLGRMSNPFEQLGVAVERGQHPLEDQGDVVEPRLQQGLSLDTLDLQLHFVQADIGADADLHEVAHLSIDRDLRSQVSDFDIDLIDLDDGNVEKDVGTVWQLVRIDYRIVGELMPSTGPLRGRRFIPVIGPGA